MDRGSFKALLGAVLLAASFGALAQKTTLTVNPMTGEDLQKLVAQVSDLSPELLEKVRVAYTTGN